MNFIEEFLNWTKDSESPESFFLWTGLSAISAVMRDNLFQQWKYDKLYPNMYILIVAPPALGKRLPMAKAGDLIKKVKNTRIFEGSATIQAVIKELGNYSTTGQKGASCIIYAEEFTSFHVKDQSTNELLTDLWDYHPTWGRLLISWQAQLKGVCFSLVTGSNETLLKGVLDDRAMFGGFLSRSILVIENRKRKRDAMFRPAGADELSHFQEVEDKLAKHLVNLSKLKGSIVPDEDAIVEFEHWYDVQWEYTENNPRTKTGIEGRMKTHIKKVAMALAMCEENLDLVIRKRHIEIAIELCVGLYKNYQLMSQESGKSPLAHSGAILLRILSLSKEFQLARKTILRRNVGEFSVELLDQTVATLIAGELISEVNQSNETYYRLTPYALELYGIAVVRKGKLVQ